MLKNDPYGFDLIKKYTVLFGATFSDILIYRTNEDGTLATELLKVPISYSAKEKMLVRVDSDPDIARPFSSLLPRLGFNITGLNYDATRKTPTNNYIRNRNPSKTDEILKQYVPIPYNFNFELYIMSKTLTDGYKIIEQILPMFTPDYTSSVELIPEMNFKQDIPIVFNGISQQDSYMEKLDVRRVITWTLSFTLKGYLAGPISKPGPIKFVEVNFRNPESDTDEDLISAVGNTPILEQLNIQVAMTANGEPTTDSSKSIPYNLIDFDDNWGIATDIVNFSGEKVLRRESLVTQIHTIMLDFRKLKTNMYLPLIT